MASVTSPPKLTITDLFARATAKLEQPKPVEAPTKKKNLSIEHFKSKPAQLLKLWREFQNGYFRKNQYTEHCDEIVGRYCHDLFSRLVDDLDKYAKWLEGGGDITRPPENIQYFVNKEKSLAYLHNLGMRVTAPHPKTELDDLIIYTNQIISQELQEIYWYELPKTIKKETELGLSQEKIILSSKHKFGTPAFNNTEVPRFMTEATRQNYMRAIKKHSSFKQASFRPLGLGFRGAVFLVEDSLNAEHVKPYVLKVSAAKEEPLILSGSSLAAEFHKLNSLGSTMRTRDKDDSFTQFLVYFDKVVNSEKYLGQTPVGKPNETVIATEYHPGTTIYDLARRNRFQYRDRWQANPFIVNGFTDEHLREFVQYYLCMAERGINFYDLFPQNMIYQDGQGTVKCIDVCSATSPFLNEIVAARQRYPIDYCIFDLVTYIVLHEQRHPVPVEIRSDTRRTIYALSNNTAREDLELQESLYDEYKKMKVYQIAKVLKTVVKLGIEKKKDLKNALTRLCDFKNYETRYDNYAAGMKKDFTRITENGKEYLLLIRNRLNTDLELGLAILD